MENETIQRIITERPCSYEFGKASNRVKIYFNDADDLEKQLKALERIGIKRELNEGGENGK